MLSRSHSTVAARATKDGGGSLRRPFCWRKIRPKFKMTDVLERGKSKLFSDTNFVTVSQRLADLYRAANLRALFLLFKSRSAQPCIHITHMSSLASYRNVCILLAELARTCERVMYRTCARAVQLAS